MHARALHLTTARAQRWPAGGLPVSVPSAPTRHVRQAWAPAAQPHPRLPSKLSLRAGNPRLNQTLLCRADKNGAPSGVDGVDPAKEQEFKKALERGGVDRGTAQKILDIWREAGVEDPDKLRQLLVKRSLLSLSTAALQLLLDGGAAAAAFALGNEWVADNTFGGATFAASGLVFLLAGYFAAGAFFDLFTVGAIALSSLQFQSNSGTFLAAMKDIAGTQSGLDVVDKAAQAVNMVKVMNALTKIQSALKDEAKAGQASTLQELTAYLVLSNAESKYGFTPEKYALTSAQASSIAVEYAKWDTNDDGKLELSEFEKMAAALDMNLAPEEAKVAFEVIDTDKSKYIEFVEFVEWWVNKVKPAPATTT